MSDDDRDLQNVSPQEREAARRLSELGPLMRRQREAEGELDPAFMRSLRARLGGEAVPPAPPPKIRRRIGSRPVKGVPRLRIPQLAAVAAAVIALLLGVIFGIPQGGSRPASSFLAPAPTRQDLLFSFPVPQGLVRRLTPTLSLLHLGSGVAYPGRLTFVRRRLGSTPRTLRAYRLALSPGVASLGRAVLRIRSPLRTVTADGARWSVAADGGPGTGRPLHSIAVSRQTGELIYHDRRNHLLPRARRMINASRAVRIARLWLASLGWPAWRMPLRFSGPVTTAPKVREVILGWPGVGAAATEAASFWITPDGSVVEAWVWPPIARSGVVPARQVTAAWKDVQNNRLPTAVPGLFAYRPAPGIARVDRSAVVAVLVPVRAGGLFLVPTYRFSGEVRIQGHGTHPWYSLAPGSTSR